MHDRVRVGLTLPVFVDDPEVPLAVATAADRSEIDGVFVFDHLFPVDSSGERPALALEPILGAVAATTSRVAVGSLVARATMRHPATLSASFDTVNRVAPGRFIAGVGSGDSASGPEHEMFGLPTGDLAVRMSALEATVQALRGHGYPVWIGGRAAPVIATAAGLADGWNGWGLSPGAFGLVVERLRAACRAADRGEGAVTPTWAGLVELRPDAWAAAKERPDVLAGPYDAMAATLRRLADAGAEWLVLAPVDPTHPDNPAIISEELLPLLG